VNPRWPILVVGPITLAALLAVSSLYRPGAVPKDVALENGARMEWTRCWFWIPAGQSANCGYYYPSQSRQARTGDEIRLAVVRIRSSRSGNRHSPILVLHGGPGYPLGLDRDGIRYWWRWIAHHGWERDIVFFDQRGAGLSRPVLKCPEFLDTAEAIVGQALAVAEEFTYWAEATRKCRARLVSLGIDLSKFTTAESASDVGELMELLGSSDWNLYSASYGTRLAQRVARDYPQRLRSIVLDSVYPVEVNSLLADPFIMDHAIQVVVDGCRTEVRCRSRFPNLEETLLALFERLRGQPVKFDITRPDTGKAITVAVNDQRLLWAMFFALYDPHLVALIPLSIDSAWRRNYTEVKPLVDEYVRWLFDSNFSDAVYLSVECHDLRPDTTHAVYMAEVTRFPRVRRFVEKGWEQNLCRIWKNDADSPWNHRGIRSKVSTLLLAGRFDPVTPPVWARMAAHQFRNAAVYEFPGAAHGVLDSSECAGELVRDFFNAPNPEKQPSCIDDLRGPEFHIQFNSYISKETFMPPIDINLTAVVVVTALVFALGALWYSPLMFAESWMRYNGYTAKQLKAMNKKSGNWPLIVTAAAQFVMALILAVLISYSGVSTSPHGVSLGLLVWLGIAAPVGLISNMFSEKPLNAFWIDASFHAVALGIMGGILATWR
jgi:pimeloyl-ACP methyl ester carboxylesterase